MAGGTDLLGTLKDAVHPRPPEVLVDLKRIEGLDRIEVDDHGLRIGALTRLRQLESHPAVKKEYGLLAEAAKAVASPQLRNMGTVGGNICQEPRCWYYRYPDNGFHCLRKGGDNCPALTGENRYHSIFGPAKVGDSPCTRACPASTDVPAYLALVREDDWDGAARRILQVNPMPAVTGRVCPHFCQEECNRHDLDESVSIRAVERRLGDYILDHADRFMAPPESENRAVRGRYRSRSGRPGLRLLPAAGRTRGHGVRPWGRSRRHVGLCHPRVPAASGRGAPVRGGPGENGRDLRTGRGTGPGRFYRRSGPKARSPVRGRGRLGAAQNRGRRRRPDPFRARFSPGRGPRKRSLPGPAGPGHRRRQRGRGREPHRPAPRIGIRDHGLPGRAR